ncbi:sulfite exporter TauE/SafE family protein [Aureispira sp. CCB-E]|uniref:sulfite exporter TauE/SafE family protein n=1 Tax=Aureispira sp. CCB-E TaxID=3051121 RepID=UPI002868475C|nr:sulfite exporter TauE/SafE family protein [Aureispira sp. CCB-E]WMX14578.1 sulfite exporter TauE/SafE family protein [Aureispira sp. CCB-E]
MELYAWIVLCGAFAGFVATLAGLGSVLTLYVLIQIVGLDADIANGTNRIGIMAMALMALPTFYKNGHLNVKKSWWIILSIFVGALGGAVLAAKYIDNDAFKDIFKYLLLVMLVLVLANPKKWIRSTDHSHKMNKWMIPIFILMGFYAGFIQVGTGVFLVVFLALAGRYSLVDANGIKLAAIALYTIACIAIFAVENKIDWEIGTVLAIGQGIGAYLAAKFATTYPKSNGFVRYLLIVMLIVAIVQMFELHTYFVG